MTHHLKLHKEYADAVLSGDKSFEIRFDDRGYQKGDYIQFNVIDGPFNVIDGPFEVNHKLNDKIFIITYVLHGWGLQENWCALAIKEAENE